MAASLIPVLMSCEPKNGCIWLMERKKAVKSASHYFYRNSPSTNGLIACCFQPESVPCDTKVTRRSGNFKPSIWDFEYIQSLKNEYSEERYAKRVSELKSQVKMMLDGEEQKDPIEQLEFIDDLQRLGVSYHFEDKVKLILTKIYEQTYMTKDTAGQKTSTGNLYDEALSFRLFRQHGFAVSQDVFESFKDEKGEYKSSLTNDTKGLLQLYEASHLLFEGEHNLEQAREFSTIFLTNYLDHCRDTASDPEFSLIVSSALELPLHWRAQRPHTRLFIDTYEQRSDANRVVLEFATLDFNILQAAYQEELKDVSRWWRRTGLGEKLPFARDMLVECYFWTTGLLFEPQYKSFRVMTTKIISFITVIDDIYDVHGTLEELELFTDVFEKWDIEKMNELPHYMQVCFSAVNNFVNDTAHEALKDCGFLIVPYLRKSWNDLCNSYLKEAKWYSQGYTPNVEEYMDNAWVSISAPTIITQAFFMVTKPVIKDVADYLYTYPDVVRWSGTILRLGDDLGTSQDEMKRGDVSKFMKCYMTQTGVNEGDANDYALSLMWKTWKKMNKERIEEVQFPKSLIRVAINLGRMSHYMYQHGDGHGTKVDSPIKYSIEGLLFKPIGYC